MKVKEIPESKFETNAYIHKADKRIFLQTINLTLNQYSYAFGNLAHKLIIKSSSKTYSMLKKIVVK